MIRASLGLALAVLLLGATSPPPFTPAMAKHVDAVMNAALARQFVPGAEVAIAENGRLVYVKGYGLRDVDDALPVDARTAFAIGSVTKQFTAAGIMLLAQRGLVDVDAPLSTYLPDAPHASEVTLRNLLTHTSGIVGFTEQPDFSLVLPTTTTPAQIVATIQNAPLAFKPGTKWEYSNTNFVLLGQVIAKLSGEPYDAFLKDRLFDPLGLHRSWFTRIEEIHPDTARGYTEFMLGMPVEHASLADWSWYDAAGGLTMSAADLARWDIALDAGRVVSPASFTEMTTPQRLTNGTSTNYGFGLGVGSVYGHPTVGHDGLVSGFSAENLTFPQDRVAIVVLANSDGLADGPLIGQLSAIVYGIHPPAKPFKPIAQDPATFAQARFWLEALLHGTLDRSRLSSELSQSLPAYRIDQLRADGKLLGEPLEVAPAGVDPRPPLTIRSYRVRFKNHLARYIYTMNDAGKLAGFAIEAWD
ncbi:MAG TPA: serine hydrolase domain-containing protein [Candidatus Baltobacteraceae bacterium]